MRVTHPSTTILLPFLGCLIFFTHRVKLQSCNDESFCNGLDDFCFEASVKKYCPKMCNTCPKPSPSAPPPQPSCVDSSENCPGWKDYCKNSGWMQRNCKKTCGLCGAQGWSECTKSCGGGTRHREKCSGSQCETLFEPCATNECPRATCYSPEKRRYMVPGSCCRDEVLPYGSECGQPYVNSKVLGGVSAKLKRWPWMVAVITTNQEFCAGVLISKNFVLSAAHCFVDGLGRLRKTSRWKLRVGLLKLNDVGIDLTIKKVTVHPKYRFPKNDIVVIELDKSVTLSSTVQPICLPGGEVTPQDSTCFVTGWGISEKSPDSTTDHLQEAAIQNLDRRICQRAFGKEEQMEHVMPFLNGDTGYLCAGSLNKKVDSCAGDSGGPIVCQRCSACTWYVAGLVSFGFPDCGRIGIPGVYTRVRDFEGWIAEVTGLRQEDKTCP